MSHIANSLDFKCAFGNFGRVDFVLEFLALFPNDANDPSN